MKNIVIAFLMLFASTASAQVYKTSTGTIKFFSHTDMEDIDATNSQVSAAMEIKSGVVEFSATVNSFQFKKALMQKHFQENYLETTKYPKSTFKGKITNNSAVDYTKDGTYTVSVTGKLTMHGVSKDITIPGKVTISGGKITLIADYKVKLKDYNIKVPAQNASNISEDIAISVNCTLTKK